LSSELTTAPVSRDAGREPPARRVLAVAMKNAEAARDYMRRMGLDGPIIGAMAAARRPLDLRRRVVSERLGGVLFHSIDWRRETAPQLPELLGLALLGIPVEIADDSGAPLVELSAARRWAAPGRTLADAVRGSGRVLAEYGRARRLVERGREPGPSGARLRPPGHAAASRNGATAGSQVVLAIWFGGLGVDVGGSVTHMSGILGGFRAHGYDVTLVTNGPAPAQLDAVVDDVQIVKPSPRSHRVTGDVDRVAANLELRRLGLHVAARDRPAFVYQRHRPLLAAGLEIAQRSRVPLVLEWNASEVWTRRNWVEPTPAGDAFDGMLAEIERRVVRGSELVAAISREAREMALEVGAPPDRVPIIPNAADVAGIARAVQGVEPVGGSEPLIGWIGSFGPWHGAEVLVRALARLPDGYRLRMVGDGVGRVECERLAAELGVADRVEFRKRLPHAIAVRELAACDLLASPHVPLADRPFFGSPTKLFEYMALGRPIVASRLEQLGEVLDEGVTARLVTPGDDAELAATLAEVWTSPDRGSGLGERARAEARHHHTWDQRAERILGHLGAA
jgi:glycosyltransferase involved in cell wall biosynthesis